MSVSQNALIYIDLDYFCMRILSRLNVIHCAICRCIYFLKIILHFDCSLCHNVYFCMVYVCFLYRCSVKIAFREKL